MLLRAIKFQLDVAIIKKRLQSGSTKRGNLPVCTYLKAVQHSLLVQFRDDGGSLIEIHDAYILSLYKQVYPCYRHHTAGLGFDVAVYCKQNDGIVKETYFMIHYYRIKSMFSESDTYVMTLASSIKSSSDIVPSFIIFTATSIDPRHFPLRTTPN